MRTATPPKGPLALAASLLAALALAAPVLAQTDYPNKPVRIINPFVAGSTTDVLARALGAGLASRLGQPFVVENRGGAGGAIGTAAVARADADGYTLLFAPALVLSVHPQDRADTGYRTDSLVPICQTFINAMALVVRPESPIRSVADLVAAAKAKPGALNYGHQGSMTIPHLAMEEFLIAANLVIRDIPFRGEPLVIADVLGGRLDVASIVLGSAVGQNVRVIGVFGESRHPGFPDVPTVREQGYDVSPASFGGLMAPAGTPAPLLARLSEACTAAANDTAYRAVAERAAQPPNFFDNAAGFRARLERDISAKARVLARLKARPAAK
ncbi:MAG: tripartite tricarboxylate transporter substrate binding protein [Rhodocyclaceae bacterium]|nr:tripartite tricarboxylate transporter substrate binding protein [Rhodocyclaceae bacterium]